MSTYVNEMPLKYFNNKIIDDKKFVDLSN